MKTITTHGTPLSIPVNMTGQKTQVAKGATFGQLTQMKQVHYSQHQHQQLQRRAAFQAPKASTLGQAQVGSKTPLGINVPSVQIIPTQKSITMQQLSQIMKSQQGNQSAAIQQIITTQPTIIASMNQPQPTGTHMVAKVSLATGSPTSQIQTISASQINITQESGVTSSTRTVSTLAQPTSAVVKTVPHEASVQVHPTHTTLAQSTKLTSLSPSVVSQALQSPQSLQQLQMTLARHVQSAQSTGLPATVTVTPASQTVHHTPVTVAAVVSQPIQQQSTVQQQQPVVQQQQQPQQQQAPQQQQTVQQTQQTVLQQQQQQKSSHYAMRTRNTPKH